MQNWIKLNPRIWFLLGFVGCAVVLAIALYIQIEQEQEPCPLCITQRVFFILTGLICLAAAIHNPKHGGRKVYALLSGAAALGGAGVATRHVWIQHLPPDQIPECLSSDFSYMLKYFPLEKILKLMLSGTGDCAEVSWTLLGLSIPAWALIAFLGLAAMCLSQFWNKPTATHLK